MTSDIYLKIWARMIGQSPIDCRHNGLTKLVRALDRDFPKLHLMAATRALAGLGIDNQGRLMAFLFSKSAPQELENMLTTGDRVAAVERVMKFKLSHEAASKFVAMIEQTFWPERPGLLDPKDDELVKAYLADFEPRLPSR